MRILHLYRPAVPEMRAQAIQVVNTCHALASLGHDVTLLADRARGYKAGPIEALREYGLDPIPAFHLVLSPSDKPPAAGLFFRAELLRWLARGRSSPERSIVYARAKRQVDFLLNFRVFFPFRLVLEAHEVDSRQAAERGEDSKELRSLEHRVLDACDGLVTNCEGTLELLARSHPTVLPERRVVIHNGTDPSRMMPGRPRDPARIIAGYSGSLRVYKDILSLADVADRLPPPYALRVVGGRVGEPDYERLAARTGPRLELRPGLPYREVARALAEMDILVLCLGENLYSRELASPLKLWDYLATDRPIVAPDLGSVRKILGEPGPESSFFPYRAGDPESLSLAIQQAGRAPARTPRLRSWRDRALEIQTFLGALS